MTQKDVDRVLLVRYAVQEAGRDGSLEQMKAICYCLRNRVRAGWGDWLAVIQDAYNHSAHVPEDDAALDPNSRAYQRLLRDVDDIYFGHRAVAAYDDAPAGSGDLEDSLCTKSHECLYWAFTNRPILPKFVTEIVRDPGNHANRATMGLMMFYE